MDFVTALQRNLNDWFLQREVPKWLSVFLNNTLPQIVALLLIVIIARQAAGLTWRFIPDPPGRQINPQQVSVSEQAGSKAQSPEKLAAQIAALHLFGQPDAIKPPTRERVDTRAPETRLKLTLHGVFVDPDPKAGAAIIGKAGAKQDYYKVGGNIMSGVKLQAVYSDRVVLLRDGRSEVLKFPKADKSMTGSANAAKPIASNSPQNHSLGNYRDMFRSEPLKIFEHVRFVPVRSGRTIKGYRVLPQKNRKLYNKLGIRPSDLVTSVNGVALNDDKQALQLIDQLKDADQINLEIIRRGKPQTLTLSLN
jgi:general secretion pathway protein C